MNKTIRICSEDTTVEISDSNISFNCLTKKYLVNERLTTPLFRKNRGQNYILKYSSLFLWYVLLLWRSKRLLPVYSFRICLFHTLQSWKFRLQSNPFQFCFCGINTPQNRKFSLAAELFQSYIFQNFSDTVKSAPIKIMVMMWNRLAAQQSLSQLGI